METISKWLDFILGPDEEDYPPATAPGRSGNGHVPVGRVVPDPQQGNISGNTGSAQVHSTSSSTGSTYQLYNDHPEESADGTRRPSLSGAVIEEAPGIPRQTTSPHRRLEDNREVQRRWDRGDDWPRNRVIALSPPPRAPPLPLLKCGKSHLRGYFATPSATRPAHRENQPPSPPNKGKGKGKGKAVAPATSEERPSREDTSEMLASSYAHGLAMARSTGHQGIIEPMRIQRLLSHPARSDAPNSPIQAVPISLAIPPKAATQYPARGSSGSVPRGQQFQPRDRQHVTYGLATHSNIDLRPHLGPDALWGRFSSVLSSASYSRLEGNVHGNDEEDNSREGSDFDGDDEEADE
ncbi:hypothetical protein F5X98DRAFT_385241 [Xylaria grammica]|nr:hypothetical protein F5X98DRAFT_385241 [Xylaria grammica]